MGLGAVGVAGFMMFGSFGENGGPLNTGSRKVTAQAAGTLAGTSGTASPVSFGGAAESATPFPGPDATRMAAIEAQEQLARAGMAARVAALPASDPRVRTDAPPPAANTASFARPAANVMSSPGPLADGDAAYFRSTQLNPAAGGLSTSPIAEPSIAQNGKYVFETWNWGAARSVNGGATWSYINPYAMADFCCDQDVIYDKGRDRMFWLRQGLSGSFASPFGGTENRDLITVDNGAASLCTYDLRPSITGNPAFNNTWFDYPRISLSDNYLWIGTNVFSNAGAFVTHFLIRYSLTGMAGCGVSSFTWWSFSAGWTPALIENAREVMYMGDQIVTSSGLNDQFRVYWIYESDAVLSFVDRTIAPYTFTNRDASCPVPGGANPCLRADIRITGAVLSHNTPLPNNVGAAGDKIDFYWNVKAGNGFPLPYVESAGFFADTIAYTLRKFIHNPSVTFWYAAAAANDREQVGLSLYQFNPVASGQNPYNLIAIDDDYNTRPPGWEVYITYQAASAWAQNSSGDYLRARKHAPAGTAWIASGAMKNAAGAFLPSYTVFGRARDVNGFNRFDQQ